MKRIFFFLAFLAMLMPAFSQRVLIDGLYYNLDSSTKTAEVTYKDWTNANYVSGSLSIPETVTYSGTKYSVTSIGSSAFFNCSRLASINIPNSVTSIGSSAFVDCSRLASINIPNSVTSIGSSAFFDCSGLTSINIPNSVTSIGSSAFVDCSGLTSVTLGNSITSIENYAFSGCSSLTSVTIPNSVTSIGVGAFRGCTGLTIMEVDSNNPIYTSVDGILYTKKIDTLICYPAGREGNFKIPNSVKSIGDGAFYGCSDLKSIEIPNSVTSFGDGAFEGCTGLTSVEIPNYVNSIGNSAFENCSGLTSIALSNSVSSIRNNAFSNCSGLTQIIFESVTPPSYYLSFSAYTKQATLTIPDDADVTAYLLSDWENFLNIEQDSGTIFTENDGVFEYRFIESQGKACLLSSPGYNSLTSASIPDRVVADRYGEESFYQVTGILANAFKDCTNLAQVKFPSKCEGIGNFAFSGCAGLTSVEIPSTVKSIGNYAFEGCSMLIRVNISDLETWCNIDFGNATANPLSSAKNLWLNNESVASLSIPASIAEIKDYAFYNCKNIEDLQIHNSVTSIGSSAFSGCSGLTSIEIPGSVTAIGSSAFSGCSSLTSVVIPNSVTSIEEWAFKGCSGLTSIEIPGSVTSIGSSAFWNCSGLTSIEIPGSVTAIGSYAFYNCEFDDFSLEDGVEELVWKDNNSLATKNLYFGRTISGNITFSGLESLEVSGFVESLNGKFFKGNDALESVVINPGSGVVIENGAFQNFNSLTDLTLPEDIAEIGAYAFSGTGLKNVTVPNGIIGANAFANCNLDNIIIGAGVESIGEKAFDGSNAINAVYATPTTPPAAQNNAFSYYEAQLYVPEEAIDTYYNFTRCWYRFSGKPLVMPHSISVQGPTSIKGEAGETFQLTATISPADVTLDRILWRSTNPAVATVDNNGLVTIHNFVPSDRMLARAGYEDGVCEIIASTLYEDSPVAVVNIQDLATSVNYINPDDSVSDWQNGGVSNDIYTLTGVCLKRDASQSDLDALAPGIYIYRGKKLVVR